MEMTEIDFDERGVFDCGACGERVTIVCVERVFRGVGQCVS